MSKYDFYGYENATCLAINHEYKNITTPVDLYDALLHVWCADTCAPRMRDEYDKEHKTFGQCSITAFLVQDIFGGEVRGVKRPSGNFHCFNMVDGKEFDLTSEQFGEEELDYSVYEEQKREVHFAKEEKYKRYLLLKEKLHEYLK